MKSWKSLDPRCALLIWKIWFLYLGTDDFGGLGLGGRWVEGWPEGEVNPTVGELLEVVGSWNFPPWGEETSGKVVGSFYFLLPIYRGSEIQVDFVMCSKWVQKNL